MAYGKTYISSSYNGPGNTVSFGSTSVCSTNNGYFYNGVAVWWCTQFTVTYPPSYIEHLSFATQAAPACLKSNGSYSYNPNYGLPYPFAFPGPYDGPIWYFYCSGTPELTTSLVDPVPADEVISTGINPDANGLAAISNTVAGIAADGAAEVVVRIAAPSAGSAIQLTLTDENGNPAPAGSGNALGYLTTLLQSDPAGSTAAGQPITVTTVSTGSGAMAFAVYHAPADFVRDGNSDDPSYGSRVVLVQEDVGGVLKAEPQIDIVRPPVAFIHGIWGSGDDGDQILSSLTSEGAGLTTYALGYDGPVTVASSTPSYGSNLTVSGNNLGFSYAASIVLPELNDAIADYRTNNALGQPIAVARADIIAHSMGGDVARMLPLMGTFADNENYRLGPIHKLITIGTPHLGSPLAQQLLNGSNNCVKGILSFKHRYAITSVQTSSGTPYSGGVGDLQADVYGTSLSNALAAIQHGSVMIPTGLIAANMSQAQLAAVDTDSHAKDIRLLCGQLARDPLAQALTSSGWPTVLSSESDAVVPANSQLAGSAQNTVFSLSAEVHSPGTEDLGFAGPSELDDTGIITPEVLQLLNTPVDQSAFKPLP